MSSWDLVGGHCPNCGFDRMHLRRATSGWSEWEACSRCGYALLQGLDCTDSGDHVPVTQEHQAFWDARAAHFGPRERAYRQVRAVTPDPEARNVFAASPADQAARLARLARLHLPVFTGES